MLLAALVEPQISALSKVVVCTTEAAAAGSTLMVLSKEPVTKSPVSMVYQTTLDTVNACPKRPRSTLNTASCCAAPLASTATGTCSALVPFTTGCPSAGGVPRKQRCHEMQDVGLGAAPLQLAALAQEAASELLCAGRQGMR